MNYGGDPYPYKSFLPKQFPQFLIAQFTNPTLASGNGEVGQMVFVLNHLVDAFLKGVLRDEAVNEDILVLTDAVGAVGGLCLNSGVPPKVEVDDVAGSGEVETRASGFQGEKEDAVGAGIVLETIHHLLPLLDATASVQEEGTLSQTLFYHLREHIAHLAELCKDQHLLSTLDDTLQERE